MNPKIEQLVAAEDAIENYTTELEQLRDRALQDGIIDADEQAGMDRVSGKIDQLRTVVRRTLRTTLEENRRIWDALEPSRTEWNQQLATLHDAGRDGLGALDAAATEIETAVDDQRWADATEKLNAAMTAMESIYQAYTDEVGAAPGGGTPPSAPSVDRDQDQWNSAHAAYQSAMAALERHARAADPLIAGEIATTKTSATATEAQASTGDFGAAVTAITPLFAACAATEEKAHDVAHYNEVLASRTAMVNDPGNAAIGDAQIDDLQTEIAGLLADAQTDAGKGKFEDALAKLNRIPPIFDRRRGLIAQRSRYQTAVGNINGHLAAINGFEAAARAALQAQIDRFKAEFDANKVERTNDYSVSTPALRRLGPEFAGLRRMLSDAGSYNTKFTAFETELARLEPHAGRVAVEEFYQAMIVDRDQAVADAAASRFPAAISILDRTPAATWTAQRAIADAM